MTLLVFGKTGQVATELMRLAPDAIFLDRAAADLTDPDACAAAIRTHRPGAVINAAAYTAVDQAETEEDIAAKINGTTPGAMAGVCAEMGIPLVHISTDYVFDGCGTAAFSPADPTGPLGAYGRTKLQGEAAITGARGTYAILRTSWVFSAHGKNFVKTMLRLSETRDALSIVSDQIGGPTPADAIASACLHIAQTLIADPETSGIYHFSGNPDASWKDFAEVIFAKAGRQVQVAGISSADFPTPAARPLNSRLDCATTEQTFTIARPDWRDGLDRVLEELGVVV